MESISDDTFSENCAVGSKRKRKTEDHSECTADENSSVKSRRTKRSRTTFTDEQVSELTKLYCEDNYPDLLKQRIIAENLDLTEMNVYNWFQNRRAKERKQALKASPSISHTTIPQSNATPPAAGSSTKLEVHIHQNSSPPYTPSAITERPPPNVPVTQLAKCYGRFCYSSGSPQLPYMQAYSAVYSPPSSVRVPMSSGYCGSPHTSVFQTVPAAAPFNPLPIPPHSDMTTTWPSHSMPPPAPTVVQHQRWHVPPYHPSSLTFGPAADYTHQQAMVLPCCTLPSTVAGTPPATGATTTKPSDNGREAGQVNSSMKLPCFNEFLPSHFPSRSSNH